MIQKDNRRRMQELFFDSPSKQFSLRQISRLLKLGLPSVKRYVEELRREKLVVKEQVLAYPAYRANQEDDQFRIKKRLDMLERIYESGLVDYIHDNILPKAIVLFGSARRGEDIESSDIDLCIIGPEKKLDFAPYEKLLRRSISDHYYKSLYALPSPLRNNVLNGMILSGYVDVFDGGEKDSGDKPGPHHGEKHYGNGRNQTGATVGD